MTKLDAERIKMGREKVCVLCVCMSVCKNERGGMGGGMIVTL